MMPIVPYNVRSTPRLPAFFRIYPGGYRLTERLFMKRVLFIKSWLGSKCMTQSEAAKICGLSQQAFNRIVNGKEPPYSNRGPRIAQALGYQGDWRELFEGVDLDG